MSKSDFSLKLFKQHIDDGIFSIDNDFNIWRHSVLHNGSLEILLTPARAENIMPNGYYQLQMWYMGKRYVISVHRAIWELYYGDIPKGFIIHHKDGNKKNNNPKNLECITYKQHNNIHIRKNWVKILKQNRIQPKKNNNKDKAPFSIKEWHKKTVETRTNNYKTKALTIYKERFTDGLSAQALADKYTCTTRSIHQAISDCKKRGWLI